MKTIVIGGVAAGASAAARLRRLDEHAEIILLEKGDFISYANCGLPYHLGGVIPDRDQLLVMSPEKFASWLKVDVRTGSEATAIDRARKTVRIKNAGGEYEESYDKLLIATGSTPAGESDGKRIFHFWTLADMDRVIARLADAGRVTIVGAGFIGVEVAENLRARGLEVAMVQRSEHVLPNLDREMAHPLHEELIKSGIRCHFGVQVTRHEESATGVNTILDSGETIATDAVIVCVGVRPQSALASACGLVCGERGHITVNEHLQTSDPDIYAAGDVVEVLDPVFGGRTAIPLAGPANKQGRIAADNINGGNSVYRGSFGSSIVKVGRLTAGSVGYTETRLKNMRQEYRKLYLHPTSNASYYPGGSRMALKLLFGTDGAIFGAQIVGGKGVDKRIDTIAQAMRGGLTAPELGELELSYAPPYSSAKDPVNFAGFVAENILTGRSDVVFPDTIPADARILDVREPQEHELGAIPGAVNIRLGDLRKRLDELDRSRPIVTCCQVGLRGYLAERILKQHGFRAANLSGGWLTWNMFFPPKPATEPANEPARAAAAVSPAPPRTVLDVRTLACPGPVIRLKTAMEALPDGERLHLLAAETFERDLLNWCRGNGCTVSQPVRTENGLEADIIKGEQAARTTVERAAGSVEIVLFSNDLDKAIAAFILANGFAVSGVRVNMFFTFWGLAVLRKDPAPLLRKNWVSRMFGFMLPRGARKLALSKMNMAGMGAAMMQGIMKRQNVPSLPELIQNARDGGVKFIACDMAMGVMGIQRSELIDVDEIAGVATFAQLAKNGNTIFI